jgi:hypothetical protein
MLDFLSLLKDYQTAIPKALSKEPTTSGEAQLRLLAVAAHLWMTKVEPLSSEIDKWIKLELKEMNWAEKLVLNPWVTKMQKERENYGKVKEAGKEG